MKYIIFFLASVVFSAFSAFDIETCGDENDLLQWNKLKSTPDKGRPGEIVTVTGDADLSEDIREGSKAHVLVKFNNIKIMDITYDFCHVWKEYSRRHEHDFPEQLPKECPIRSGHYSFEMKHRNRKEMPKGTYDVRMELTNEEGQRVTCLKKHWTIGESEDQEDFGFWEPWHFVFY